MRALKVAVVALAVSLVLSSVARADGWGEVKGRVVFAGGVPAKKELKVDKDQAHCLSKGALINDELVVDEKTKGVKNVMIWLAPLQPSDKLPIHPSMASVPKEKVVVDQPCCMFEPHITMMREGQTLEIKNSAPVLHNAKIIGSATGNGTINLSVPPGQSITKQPRAEKRPMMVACDIHKWMSARIGVFNHPYFAVTKDDGSFEIKNAPAGKFRIFILHEKANWLHKGQTPAGQEISITAGGVLDLGIVDLKAD